MIEIVFFLNAISSLSVTLVASWIALKFSGSIYHRKMAKLFVMLAILFFFPFLLNLGWGVGTVQPTEEDFLLIQGVLNFFTALIILVLTYWLTRNKGLGFLTGLFVLSAFGSASSSNLFFLIISGTSYGLIFLMANELLHFKGSTHRKSGLAGIAYSTVSMVLLFFVSGGVASYLLFWFAPNLLLVKFFQFFFNEVAKEKPSIDHREKKRMKNTFFLLLKLVFLVVFLNVFLLLSTISIHELGHALAAKYYDCQLVRAVIFDSGDLPHTEFICKGYFNETVITSAGLIFTLIVALALLLTESRFIRAISFIMISYSIMIAQGDLANFLGFSDNLLFFLFFAAIIVAIFGILSSARFFMEQLDEFYYGSREGFTTFMNELNMGRKRR